MNSLHLQLLAQDQPNKTLQQAALTSSSRLWRREGGGDMKGRGRHVGGCPKISIKMINKHCIKD